MISALFGETKRIPIATTFSYASSFRATIELLEASLKKTSPILFGELLA